MQIENKSFRPVTSFFLCVKPASYNPLILTSKHWLQTATIRWSPVAYITRAAVSDLNISKPTDLT